MCYSNITQRKMTLRKWSLVCVLRGQNIKTFLMGASYILTHINLHTFAKYLPKIIGDYCHDTIITMNSSTHIAEHLHQSP